MIESSANPTAVFESYGLCSKGWRAASAPLDEDSSGDIPLAFCNALEKLGGLYATFGHFLSWRADLLGAACLTKLASIKPHYTEVALPAVAAIVRRELGKTAPDLATHLEGPPLWSTLSRTAYLSKHQDRPVIVQVARDSVSVERLAGFERSMLAVRHPETAAIVSSEVLTQFRQWIRNGESLADERSFLNVLSQHRGETLASYPYLIPELSTPDVICWHAVQGRSARELIGRGSGEITIMIASAILEQFYSLSMVDADPDPDAMIVDHNNQLHFRRLNNPIAVPPSVVNDGIKYVSAVLAGDASLSAQKLIRLVMTRPPLNLEKDLVDKFSGVDPELKINRWFPPSVGAFESNWRALAGLISTRPLFVDCLHRNLIATGYWNSDAVRSGAVPHDAVSEAHSPVVGRMLRTQFGMLLNKESASEWIFGSGLLMFGALREMNRLVEEVRDNDLTLAVDIIEPARPGGRKGRLSHGVILGSLLVVLMMSLLWGGKAPEPWPLFIKLLAVGTLPGMFWAVSRMG